MQAPRKRWWDVGLHSQLHLTGRRGGLLSSYLKPSVHTIRVCGGPYLCKKHHILFQASWEGSEPRLSCKWNVRCPEIVVSYIFVVRLHWTGNRTEDASWPENMENVQTFWPKMCRLQLWLQLVVLSVFILKQFSTSLLPVWAPASGRSHVGCWFALYASEEQKKIDLWRVSYYLLPHMPVLLMTSLMGSLQNSSIYGCVFTSFKRRVWTNRTRKTVKNCSVSIALSLPEWACIRWAAMWAISMFH